MMDYEYAIDEMGKPYLRVRISDYALIKSALLNKGMAFTEKERQEFNLLGLIPPDIATLDTQCERSYKAFQNKSTDIEKYSYLRDLQDSNETLYYSLLVRHIEEMMPIVYTPTVGLGCQRFSQIYRRPRGIFIAYPYREQIDRILANPRFDKVKVIVVSDGERILGLGDQGAGGMGIPIGKLALYSAYAGIHPALTLPILLDTGTNNPDLRNDPLYVGWRHERVRGQAYLDFVDAFVRAVKKRYQHVLLQWEDFAQVNAYPLLERYQNECCTFNDDIQGTAAVAAGALLAAIHVTRVPLKDQRVVIAGAGSAGCGIAKLLFDMMVMQGLSPAEASERFYLVDRQGLLLDNMPALLPFQHPFAKSPEIIARWSSMRNQSMATLEEVVRQVHPTLLLGVSGQAGIFTESMVREMAAFVERPIIFPLSNPTSQCEAVPENLLKWTNGRAIIGTGSPFAPVHYNGRKYIIDQTNNSYIFPGLGLGLIAVKASRVTDRMFIAAALALADLSPAKFNPNDNLLPSLAEIREVSLKVALAVAKEAMASGLAMLEIDRDLEKYLYNYMWVPDYLPYRRVNQS